ncbi:MAG: TrmH family RNA methyltransferase [Bacteroidia bacterium]|jgi:TrmH family RNA methyltransferase
MNGMQEISSIKNPIVKKLQALHKKKGRLEHDQFLVEGIREIGLALESGAHIEEVFFNLYWNEADLIEFLKEYPKVKTYLLADEVFDKLSYRDSVANCLASCRLFDTDLKKLSLPPNALVLVLEAIEKPGNMGAIFRTADAAGADAVIIANANTDIYNPNVIRASLGSVFTVPFAIGSNKDVLHFLRKHQFKIYSTFLEGSIPHYSVDMKSQSTALVMGSEAFGITKFWQEESDAFIKIPMHGKVDSMNVSTAAAVVTYEAHRQRMSSQ